RVRRRIREAFSRGDDGVNAASAAAASTSTGSRIEPSLVQARGADDLAENPRRFAAGGPDDDYAPPLEVHARIASEVAAGDFVSPAPLGLGSAVRATAGERNAPQPDPDIERIGNMPPARPVSAGALAAGLHARLGRPVRWFGR